MPIDRSKVCPQCNLEMCLADQQKGKCSRNHAPFSRTGTDNQPFKKPTEADVVAYQQWLAGMEPLSVREVV